MSSFRATRHWWTQMIFILIILKSIRMYSINNNLNSIWLMCFSKENKRTGVLWIFNVYLFDCYTFKNILKGNLKHTVRKLKI